MLEKLIEAGINVARLNFSHGTFEEHAARIQRIRSAAAAAGKPIAIMQDLQGPKVRTGPLAPGDEFVRLVPGNSLTLTTEFTTSSSQRVFVDLPDLPQVVKQDETIMLDDGRLELRVTAIRAGEVETVIVLGGKLTSHKGLNLPGAWLSKPPLTEKDLADLAFGLEQQVDIVAMSFVRQASDIWALRTEIERQLGGRRSPLVVAKIERPEAIDNLEQVLEAADGVMVARGDLGVELSPARIPSLQKRIIQQANQRLIPVITATEMLDSMIRSPRPTRAEASDVANAVFDGSDALMLSGETASGDYPLEAVHTMVKIIIDAEQNSSEWGFVPDEARAKTSDDAVATTLAAREIALDREVAAIAVFTRSGRTGRIMSKSRPHVPILAFTPELDTYNRLALYWGVEPHLVAKAHSVEEMIERLESAGLESGVIKNGDQVVVVSSLPIGAMGLPNFVLLHTIGKKMSAA